MYCRLPQVPHHETGGGTQCRCPRKNKQHFLEYMLPSKMVSDTGTNSVSEKFEKFCKQLSIHNAALLSYNHQGNWKSRGLQTFVENNKKNAMKLMLIFISLHYR